VSAEPAYDDVAVQAIARAYVACRLAMEALPDLPEDLRTVVEEPIASLCRVVGPELERLRPDAFGRHDDLIGPPGSEPRSTGL
jgi:hypothetical protein